MHTKLTRHTLVLILALVLTALLFLVDFLIPSSNFWGRYLLPILIVFLWGQRSDVLIVAVCASLLVIAGYSLEPIPAPGDFLINHVLAIGVLWLVAWTLAQRMHLQEQLVAQHKEILRREQDLEAQVTARTADLKASEQQLTKIFCSNPAGIAITRQSDGCCVDANDAYLAIVGYSRDQVIGHSLVDLGIMTLAARTEVRSIFRQQGYMRGVDLQIANAQGEAVDILYSLEQIDFNGEPCYLGLIFDITERKRLERALRQSEQKFAAIFAANPVAVAVARYADNTYLDVNHAYATLFGFSGAEMIGHSPVELGIITVEQRAEIADRVRSQAHNRAIEVQLTAKDGSSVAVLATTEPVTIDGEPCELLVMVDITARLEAEKRVQETLQQLRLATEAAAIGIWKWNFADDSLEWDERMCELYGVPLAARQNGIYYDVWRSSLHPDDLEFANSTIMTAAQNGSPWQIRFRIVLPDGTLRHIQASSVVDYDLQRAALRMIGINRDITDQMHYEQLLQDTNALLEQRVAQRTADLQRANRLKDEFMAMISHELRTPLTGVLTLSEMLALEVAGPLTERQAVYVRSISESGERLLAVINGILSYTHLISGKLQLQREPCNLAELLAICAASQQHRANARQQTISVFVEPPDLTITSDSSSIAGVLKNLLDNAIKFTPEGGQVGLEAHLTPGPAGQIGPRNDLETGTVDLVVWDTGLGIAPDDLERIFKPFVQADGSLSRHHEGIGMGLAYVDQMVRLLGGTLAVESDLGRGSRFTATIPRQ